MKCENTDERNHRNPELVKRYVMLTDWKTQYC